MPPLQRPWVSWRRAQDHRSEFVATANAFLAEAVRIGLGACDVDPQTGERVYKLRLPIKPPPMLDNIAADVACNIRAALDQAMYDCSVAAHKKENLRNTQFPFGDTSASADAMRANKSSDIPPWLFDMAMSFKPYRDDGDIALWATNRLTNQHKHKSTVRATARVASTLEYLGIGLPGVAPPAWDYAAEEAVVARYPASETHQPVFGGVPSLEFSAPAELRGASAEDVLQAMLNCSAHILGKVMLEAEQRGLVQG